MLDSLREADDSVVGTIDFLEHAIHEVLHALGALLETSKVVPIHEVEHLRGSHVEQTHNTFKCSYLAFSRGRNIDVSGMTVGTMKHGIRIGSKNIGSK